MIRSHEAPNSGLVLFTTSNPRRRLAQRRSVALAVILGVAFSGALIAQLSSAHDAGRPVPPGPFSYFPN